MRKSVEGYIRFLKLMKQFTLNQFSKKAQHTVLQFENHFESMLPLFRKTLRNNGFNGNLMPIVFSVKRLKQKNPFITFFHAGHIKGRRQVFFQNSNIKGDLRLVFFLSLVSLFLWEYPLQNKLNKSVFLPLQAQFQISHKGLSDILKTDISKVRK